MALDILTAYLKPSEPTPLFVVRYRTKGDDWCERRMADHRIWKLVNTIGKRIGVLIVETAVAKQTVLEEASAACAPLMR